MTSRWLLVIRALAVAIAMLGATDPVVTLPRRKPAIVAIVTTPSGGDAAMRDLRDRARQRLASSFTVVDGPFSAADAVVVIGRDVPSTPIGAAPVIAVVPDASVPRVDVDRVDAPSRASVEGRVPVTVRLHAVGARGRSDRIVLESAALALDRTTRTWKADDEWADVTLTFAPSRVGAIPLRLRVEREDNGQVLAAADTAVDVGARTWQVCVHDARPSWMSTFVRRALEDDRRFVVRTETQMSRGLSVETGAPPVSLSDAARIDACDAVVVGAPDALTASDVNGLDGFARRRGGSIVLLLDTPAAGAAGRLIGVTRWMTRQGSASIAARPDPAAPRGLAELPAADFAWPSTALPDGAQPIASATIGGAPRPVVWQVPIGSGRAIVSGVLDAWRYRADGQATFAAVWRLIVGTAAEASPSAMEVRVGRAIAEPGSEVEVDVTSRASATGSAASTEVVSAWIERVSDAVVVEPIRLWPDTATGRFRGRLRAPLVPGVFRVVARDPTTGGTGAIRGESALLVTPGAISPVPDRSSVLAAWARARHGVALPAAEVDAIAGRVAAVLRLATMPVPVHVMRSWWWMLPFTLLLGFEWWVRRRAGAR